VTEKAKEATPKAEAKKVVKKSHAPPKESETVEVKDDNILQDQDKKQQVDQ
jgi:hypothetical protein